MRRYQGTQRIAHRATLGFGRARKAPSQAPTKALCQSCGSRYADPGQATCRVCDNDTEQVNEAIGFAGDLAPYRKLAAKLNEK